MQFFIWLLAAYWFAAFTFQWCSWLIANHVHRKRMFKPPVRAASACEAPVQVDLSVIVPLYNEAQSILPCLEALFRIPARRLEIIVVDDGSTDGGGLLAQARYGSKCRIIRQPNAGKAAAMNAGLAIARHPWIMFLDADTFIDPSGIVPLLELLAASPLPGQEKTTVSQAVLAAGGAVLPDDPQGWLSGYQMLEYRRAFGIGLTSRDCLNTVRLVPGACSCFSAAALRAAGGFESSSITEDLEIIYRLQEHFHALRHSSIRMIPHVIATTSVPDSFPGLLRQRVRWHRGLIQTLLQYRKSMFAPMDDPVKTCLMWFDTLFAALHPLFALLSIFAVLFGHDQLSGVSGSPIQEHLPAFFLTIWGLQVLFGFVCEITLSDWQPRWTHPLKRMLLIVTEPVIFQPVICLFRAWAVWKEISGQPAIWRNRT